MPAFSVRLEDSWPLLTPPRAVLTHSSTLSRGQSPRDVFTRITQCLGHHSEYCATALLVVGHSPQGVSQLRYRLQLRCLHEACCPVSSGVSISQVEISATTMLPPSVHEISATTAWPPQGITTHIKLFIPIV